jgi:DNA primase catalytic subunit
MSNYLMPKGMRLATLKERKEFYQKEFDLRKVADWLKDREDKIRFAVIIGRHTKIYPEKYLQDLGTTIIIDDYQDLEDVRRQIEEFIPEAVYYDRNIYDEENNSKGQELAFDLDPENITCPIHGTLADKMKRGQGLGFCSLELDMAKKQTLDLYEDLEKQFSNLRIVYSGRGFHIHVFDRFSNVLSSEDRKEMADKIKAKGFEIDAWVTEGEMHLIRLPFSLHGMVSRIVTPLEKKEVEKFDPIKDARCLPSFLKGKLTFS